MTEASINEFVTSECEVGRAFRISSAEFYGAYEKWCEESSQFPASQQISSRQVSLNGGHASKAALPWREY